MFGRDKTVFEAQTRLGERYRDELTGFEGIATSIHFYLHGCERVSLESWNPARQEMTELTFDAPRLIHVESQVQMTSERTGGWQPDVPQRSTGR